MLVCACARAGCACGGWAGEGFGATGFAHTTPTLETQLLPLQKETSRLPSPRCHGGLSEAWGWGPYPLAVVVLVARAWARGGAAGLCWEGAVGMWWDLRWVHVFLRGM